MLYSLLPLLRCLVVGAESLCSILYSLCSIAYWLELQPPFFFVFIRLIAYFTWSFDAHFQGDPQGYNCCVKE